MSPPLERLIRLSISIEATNPAILDGLETWLRLGLLSDEQVRQICQQYLSNTLPEIVLTQPRKEVFAEEEFSQPELVKNSPQSRYAFSELFQSLKAELSVRWLLFLGLFLVVVSSGVLAASQWEQFPATAQYLILLIYTIAFWGASLWGSRQSRLPVTAEALKRVTLLLIPLNFWAMDGLGLWQNPFGLLTIAIATFILTSLTVFLNKEQGQLQKRPLINQLGLSYLNWGWRLPGFPVIAVYLGIILTGILTLINPSPNREETKQRLDSRIVVLYLLAILLGRAIFVTQVEVSQLGLGLGIFAGFLYLSPSLILHRSSYAVLILGWVAAISTQPWQAFAVSGIGIAIFSDNLLKFWKRRDLVAIFIIGLEMVWLVARLIPPGFKQTAISVGVEVTRSQDSPWALLSLTWFPYLIFIATLTDWIYRKPKPKLAELGDVLTLGFGAFLTSLSIYNPGLRSLNLLASTLTLAVITFRRQSPHASFIYLTHITALLTFTNLIYWQFPSLSLEIWAMILLSLMVGEFVIYIFASSQWNVFRQSAWNLAIILAAFAYIALAETVKDLNSSYWALTWLIVPLALTWVATQTTENQQKLATKLSIGAGLVAQLLTLRYPESHLIMVGVVAVLMIVNTQILKHLVSAILTVGFGLAFIFLFVQNRIAGEEWFLVLASTLAGLEILSLTLYFYLRERSSVATLYRKAIDQWSAFLCTINLFLLTIHSLGLYWNLLKLNVSILLALGLTIFALILSTIKIEERHDTANLQRSTWILYSLAWAVELLVVESLRWTDYSLLSLATTNIALGLLTQLYGDWWQRRSQLNHLPNPWQIIPLIYGFLGIIFRVPTFANWTGLTTLGLALILIGIGRRQPIIKPLIYGGILGISISAYELLFYQISGESFSEQLIVSAGLGTCLMYAYRLLSSSLQFYFKLPPAELRWIAHLHWSVSSCFLLLATLNPIESKQLLAIGIAVLLVRYAIFQGRHNFNLKEAEIWIYLGLIEAALTLNYLVSLIPFQQILIPWSAAIISLICYFGYILPWSTWGWPIQPWRNVAIAAPLFTLMFSNIFLDPGQNLSWYGSAVITALLYLALTIYQREIRFSYLSLLVINFALNHYFSSLQYNLDPLILISPPALSLLYIAQVESTLKTAKNRPLRHWLRLIGIGLICGVSLLTHQRTGIIPGIISLLVIFAGLGLKTRAFLYIGTAAFLINIVNQLIILNSIYSFMKWVISFILGLILIWIAATFETRREQLIALLNNWIAELETWQ